MLILYLKQWSQTLTCTAITLRVSADQMTWLPLKNFWLSACGGWSHLLVWWDLNHLGDGLGALSAGLILTMVIAVSGKTPAVNHTILGIRRKWAENRWSPPSADGMQCELLPPSLAGLPTAESCALDWEPQQTSGLASSHFLVRIFSSQQQKSSYVSGSWCYLWVHMSSILPDTNAAAQSWAQ